MDPWRSCLGDTTRGRQAVRGRGQSHLCCLPVHREKTCLCLSFIYGELPSRCSLHIHPCAFVSPPVPLPCRHRDSKGPIHLMEAAGQLLLGKTGLSAGGGCGDALSCWRCGQAGVHPIARSAWGLLPLELATKLLLTWERQRAFARPEFGLYIFSQSSCFAWRPRLRSETPPQRRTCQGGGGLSTRWGAGERGDAVARC